MATSSVGDVEGPCILQSLTVTIKTILLLLLLRQSVYSAHVYNVIYYIVQFSFRHDREYYHKHNNIMVYLLAIIVIELRQAKQHVQSQWVCNTLSFSINQQGKC